MLCYAFISNSNIHAVSFSFHRILLVAKNVSSLLIYQSTHQDYTFEEIECHISVI